MSASTDNTVAIWDVLTGECTQRYRFPSPILKVQYHPRKADIFLVCPMRHAAVLVEQEGSHKLLPLDEDEVLNYIKLRSSNHSNFFATFQSDLNITASFDRRGQYIYTGNGRGRILVLDADSLEVKEN